MVGSYVVEKLSRKVVQCLVGISISEIFTSDMKV